MATTTAPIMDTRCSDERRPKSIILQSPATGMLWFGGWLFTIAFAQLGFWKAVLALVIWPYFLGVLAR